MAVCDTAVRLKKTAYQNIRNAQYPVFWIPVEGDPTTGYVGWNEAFVTQWLIVNLPNLMLDDGKGGKVPITAKQITNFKSYWSLFKIAAAGKYVPIEEALPEGMTISFGGDE
jgi:hypothetical protein